ncbi:MAG: hypothetical protein NTV86_19050 [Planctomycetota bacterium]|nr:hypothetical protein [Planctomycetota bacterium]
MSVKTIASHCERIKRKLGLASAEALREFAIAWHETGLYAKMPSGRPVKASWAHGAW